MKIGIGITGCIVLLMVLVVVGGCGGKGKITSAIEDEQTRLLREQSLQEAYNHFTNASILEMAGAYREALVEYEQALFFDPRSATIRFDYARLLFRLQRLQEAMTQAMQVEPKDAETYLLIGDCHRLKDKIPEAMAYYRKVVELDSDNINAYWYLSSYYRQAEQFDSAIVAMQHLARLSDTYRIWLELGTLQGRAQKYEQALIAFQRSLALCSDEKNINAFLGLATTYEALDSLDLAEQTLRRAIEIDPRDLRIWRQMLAMFVNRENLSKALEASTQVITMAPSDWLAQRRHGILLFSAEQYDQADSLFRSRIDSGDEHVLNFFYLGLVAMNGERWAEARAFLHEAVERDSTFADAWLNLAFTYRQEDSIESALAVYKQALTQTLAENDRVRLLYALGAGLEQGGRLQEAVTAFEQLIALDSNYAPALNYLGYMLADAGIRLQYALELINRALAISPDNGAYIDSYAWVQHRLGNNTVALTELQRAARLIDNDPVIYEHLGDVCRAMGNRQEAEEHYRKALEIAPGSINIEEKLKQ